MSSPIQARLALVVVIAAAAGLFRLAGDACETGAVVVLALLVPVVAAALASVALRGQHDSRRSIATHVAVDAVALGVMFSSAAFILGGLDAVRLPIVGRPHALPVLYLVVYAVAAAVGARGYDGKRAVGLALGWIVAFGGIAYLAWESFALLVGDYDVAARQSKTVVLGLGVATTVLAAGALISCLLAFIRAATVAPAVPRWRALLGPSVATLSVYTAVLAATLVVHAS